MKDHYAPWMPGYQVSHKLQIFHLIVAMLKKFTFYLTEIANSVSKFPLESLFKKSAKQAENHERILFTCEYVAVIMPRVTNILLPKIQSARNILPSENQPKNVHRSITSSFQENNTCYCLLTVVDLGGKWGQLPPPSR